MAGRSWMRQRVQAFPLSRAPDGSAYEKCKRCGLNVAIAISNMHQCKARKVRKRPRNNPDFVKCGHCGVFIEISSLDGDLHECNPDAVCRGSQSGSTNRYTYKLNVVNKSLNVDEEPKKPEEDYREKETAFEISRLPQSAFRFFMESFEKTCCGEEDWFEIDRKGFQKWVEMTLEEQRPYKTKAKAVEEAYEISVRKEMKDTAEDLPTSESCANFDKESDEPVYISRYSDEYSDPW